MRHIFIFFILAAQAFVLQAQSDYWGIEFSLSDKNNYIGYSEYQNYEAAFRQGDDAKANGFAGIPIHFDIDSRKFIYTDEGGLSTNKTLLQIHKISTGEIMNIFFQLEAKCSGICMIGFPRIPFQHGTFDIVASDIVYNPIVVNKSNQWQNLDGQAATQIEATPKAITEIPYYPNPAANTPPIFHKENEVATISQPLARKPRLTSSQTHIELAAQSKGANSFLIKCSTPNRLEKPIATIFEFNTDYNQIIIEFKDIPNNGASASPLSKEIPIPNIPRKTYNLIVLYNNVRSVGKLIYTGNRLEIQLENSENILVVNPVSE